jgi:nitrate/nitrite transporter NarK
MLLFSPRAGALAQRIGPRIPLTVGSILVAVGMFMLSEIDIGDSYVDAILPAIVVFGVGLTLVVAPVTITVLAAADPRQAGIASGVNNAVARTGGLLAVATLPMIAGLSGADYEDPNAISDAFTVGMRFAAALAAAGGVVAFFTITDDVLERAKEPDREPCQEALAQTPERHCAVAGTPIHSAGHARASAQGRRREPHPAADLADSPGARPTRAP